jgi:hypothetical protein
VQGTRRRGERTGVDDLLEHLQLAGVDHPQTITGA